MINFEDIKNEFLSNYEDEHNEELKQAVNDARLTIYWYDEDNWD